MSDLTPYVTPAMLLSSNFGISWGTFPKASATEAQQIAAQLDLCATVTSEMDTIANQTLRATLNTEREFGPDFVITVLPNGWTRFRLSSGPILQLVSADFSPASASPPNWQGIPVTALMTEHTGLPATGSIVPAGAGPDPTAVLIAPGYVGWNLGRKGYLVQMQSISGFPVTGIDTAAVAGASTIHVDDITGWWNGTAGARGTIQDPPLREQVTVAGATPDVADAISGPGTLTLLTALQFDHTPTYGSSSVPNQTVLLTAMPSALVQAGYYLATHYGLIRGATAAVVQTARGAMTTSGVKGSMDWYDRAETIISRYGRVS